MSRISHLALATRLLVASSACAFRSPRIAELQNNPARYQNRSVNISGVVTSSWGLPLLPYKFYRVDDGSGEVVVLSQNSRLTPTRGSRVRVRGRVTDVAVVGGQAVGMHLREEDLSVRR